MRVRQGEDTPNPISNHVLSALFFVGFDRDFRISLQKTNPFRIQFYYGKCMNAKRSNKSNRKSEHAVSNSGITETSFKFDGRSEE